MGLFEIILKKVIILSFFQIFAIIFNIDVNVNNFLNNLFNKDILNIFNIWWNIIIICNF